MFFLTQHFQKIKFKPVLLVGVCFALLFPIFSSAQVAKPDPTNGRVCYVKASGAQACFPGAFPESWSACEAAAGSTIYFKGKAPSPDSPITGCKDMFPQLSTGPSLLGTIAGTVGGMPGSAKELLGKVVNFGIDTVLGGALKGIAWAIFSVAALFLQAMSVIMDQSIALTLNSNAIRDSSFIRVGWTAVRDISNMFFIFALLYIAILTILGLAGGGTKRWLAHLIIAAILINFSLFSTKVIIDAGNILGLGVWNKIQVKQGSTTVNSASAKILQGLDLQTVLEKDVARGGSGTTYMQDAMIYAGGAIFMFIAGYVMLAGALMMLTRTISLIMLMIFSPFAFMAFGLPKLEKYGHQWLDKLISQTFAAPFFIFMLYLNTVMIDNFDLLALSGASGASFGGALSGRDPKSSLIILNYILLIGFLISSISIANSFAGETGQRARGFAKKASGWMAGGAIAGGAMAGRQTVGRLGKMTAENEKLKMLAEKKGFIGGLAKIARRGGDSAQQATFDVRSTKMFGATAGAALKNGGIDAGKGGGKGGYEASGGVLASVSRTGGGIGALATLAGAGKVGYIGTDNQDALKKHAEEMRKRGFAPEEIKKYTADRAGAAKTRARRRLRGYENNEQGLPDITKPVYEVVDGKRISGYLHPAFKKVRTNISLDKATRAADQAKDDLQRIATNAIGIGEPAQRDAIALHIKTRHDQLTLDKKGVIARIKKNISNIKKDDTPEQQVLDALKKMGVGGVTPQATAPVTPPASTPVTAPTTKTEAHA